MTFPKTAWQETPILVQFFKLLFSSKASRKGKGANVIKNWLPLLLTQEFAIESIPSLSCRRSLWNSSENL